MSVSGTIAKNTLFNFLGTASETIRGLVIGILLARGLGAEQYGLYSLLVWFLSLAFIVVNLGMSEMAKRFIAEATGQRNAQVEKGMVRLTLVVRFSAIGILAVLILFLSKYLAVLFNRPADSVYFMYVVGLFITGGISGTIEGFFAGFQKFEYLTCIYLISNTLQIASVIILSVLGLNVKEVLFMLMSVYTVNIFTSLFFLNRIFPIRELLSPLPLEPALKKSAIKYSLAAFGVLGVNYFLWQQAEVFLLGMYRPIQEVGFYNIAHRIPSMAVALIPFVFGSVLLPAIAEQFGKGDMEKIKMIYATAARYLMMLSFAIAAACISLAEPIITLMYGSGYAPAVVLMQIVSLPFSLLGLSYAVSSVIYGIKEPTYLLKIGVILICLSIGLNFLLIPKYGAIGAVIATSIPRLIALPIYIRFVSKKIGQPWPMSETAKIAAAAAGMGLVVFFIQHYLSLVPGICLGVISGIILYPAALLALNLVKPRDIEMLQKFEERLPSILKRPYAAIISIVGRFVKEELPSSNHIT